MAKPRKIGFGLLMMVTALCAVAAPASATIVTSPAGTPYTGRFHGHSEGHVIFHHTGGATIECGSTIEWSIASHGSTVTATGSVQSLTFSGCTNSWTVTTVKGGTAEEHSVGGGGGTVTSTGTEITMQHSGLGLHCVYTTSFTDLGVLTGGTPATLDVSATIPRTGGSSGPFCGTTITWTGNYKATVPSSLFIS